MDVEPISDDSLDEAIAFIKAANPFAQRTWGWDTGRFIDWRFAGNTLRAEAEPGFFAKYGKLVRIDGSVAAMVITETGEADHCILTAGPDSELLAGATRWLIDNYEGEELVLFPSDDASWVHEILVEAGFVRSEIAGLEWGFDVADAETPLSIDGFVISSLANGQENDYPEIDRCLAGAFGGNKDRVPILRSLEANPMFRPELSVVARRKDGRIAAYCRGTVDPESGVCGIDPVASHPDFQGRGLGKAIVRACFAAQARLGGRTSFIGSAPEPSPGSRLYRSLGPTSVTAHSRWTNRS